MYSASRSRYGRSADSRSRNRSRNDAAVRRAVAPTVEALEARQLMAVGRPDHVVVLLLEERANAAIGDANMPYLNELASSGLVYARSNGVTHPSRGNYLSLISGSTQGVTDNQTEFPQFTGPNLAKSLNTAPGLSFTSYAESLPADGSLVWNAGDPAQDPDNHPDVYFRAYNPVSFFSDLGPGETQASVNRTFNAFPTNFSNLPTVSYVIPNQLHNTHGSNEPPYTPQSSGYVPLRIAADAWVRDNLDAYVDWARNNNSLLIITTDEEDVVHSPTGGLTTIVTGDPDLFVAGVNQTPVNHYNLLRTLTDMYELPALGQSAAVTAFPSNDNGQLIPGAAAYEKQQASVTLSSNANPATAGQNITFTATVTPAAGGTPTGTVAFFLGQGQFLTKPVPASGIVTFTADWLSNGNNPLTAVYGGDAAFSRAVSPVLTQVVQPPQTADPSATVVSAPVATVYGQSAQFTATVSAVNPGDGTPSGMVQFSIDNVALGPAVALVNGVATSPATVSLVPGTYSVRATYQGTTDFQPSTSAAVTHTVNKASTSTTLASSANPSTPGQSVTFTATVATTAPGGGTAAGSVEFFDGATSLGTAALNAAGVATLATSSLSTGGHTIRAVYGGSTNHNGSTSANLSQSVQTTGPAVSATALASSAGTSVFGQSVTFTATVTSGLAAVPTGTVQFFNGATSLGTATLDGTGKASLATSALPVGTLGITAVYSGSATLAGSTSASRAHTVNKAGTTTSLASSLNPSQPGQSVTFTATIAAVAPGAGVPGGTVQFVVDGANVGLPVALVNGSATSAAISSLGSGPHTVSAVYGGSASFFGSASATLTQTVQPAGSVSTTTSLASSAPSAVIGQPVTFTATVAAANLLTPGGTVQFFDGNVALGAAVALNALGQASLTTGSLAFGPHAIRAVYSGAPGFAASTSSPLVQLVSKASSTTTLTSSADPSVPGQSVAFRAVIGVVAPGAGAPTGTVQFRIDGVNFGAPVALVNGAANSGSISWAIPGGHEITAVYSGDANFNGATGTLQQTVLVTNDDFANRIAILGNSASLLWSNDGAKKEGQEPKHAGKTAKASAWWTWTAPSNGRVTIDTLGSDFDTRLAVYRGLTLKSLTSVASNDDAGGGTETSRVTFDVTAGTSYQIVVDGDKNDANLIKLNLAFTAAGRPAPVQPPAAPQGVDASEGVYADRVAVEWQPVAGAAGYEVFRMSSSVDAVKVAEVTGTSFVDTTAKAGVRYWYAVRAVTDSGTSAFRTVAAGYRKGAAPSVLSGMALWQLRELMELTLNTAA